MAGRSKDVYRRVRTRIWTGRTGHHLRSIAASHPWVPIWEVAFYLITGPTSNAIGLYYLPVSHIVEGLRRGFEGASKGLELLCEHGFAEYDEALSVVWVCNMARDQIAEKLKPNDKKQIMVRDTLLSYSYSYLSHLWWEHYRGPYSLDYGSPFEGASKGLRSQDQDQDQDQDLRKKAPRARSETGANLADLEIRKELARLFNSLGKSLDRGWRELAGPAELAGIREAIYGAGFSLPDDRLAIEHALKMLAEEARGLQAAEADDPLKWLRAAWSARNLRRASRIPSAKEARAGASRAGRRTVRPSLERGTAPPSEDFAGGFVE